MKNVLIKWNKKRNIDHGWLTGKIFMKIEENSLLGEVSRLFNQEMMGSKIRPNKNVKCALLNIYKTPWFVVNKMMNFKILLWQKMS